LIDAPIITVDGFGLFRDTEKLELIRFFAKKTGIIILTDSDRAGFKIRGYIKGAVKDGEITDVYIPDIFGKERRKTTPGREGKIGVEGISDGLLLEAFKKAGVITDGCENSAKSSVPREKITKADLVLSGLSGGKNASTRRKTLQKQLGLPENLSANGLLDVLNVMFDRESFLKLWQT
jgi:ribonuclease M5